MFSKSFSLLFLYVPDTFIIFLKSQQTVYLWFLASICLSSAKIVPWHSWHFQISTFTLYYYIIECKGGIIIKLLMKGGHAINQCHHASNQYSKSNEIRSPHFVFLIIWQCLSNFCDLWSFSSRAIARNLNTTSITV